MYLFQSFNTAHLYTNLCTGLAQTAQLHLHLEPQLPASLIRAPLAFNLKGTWRQSHSYMRCKFKGAWWQDIPVQRNKATVKTLIPIQIPSAVGKPEMSATAAPYELFLTLTVVEHPPTVVAAGSRLQSHSIDC